MKITACSIAKNESKNIESWFNVVKSCDDYYVLDTGSQDDTVSELKGLGVIVKEKEITPFDFSLARNSAIEITEDSEWILMLDFDEVIPENWRETVEKIIEDNPSISAISFLQGEREHYDFDFDIKIKLFKKDKYVWKNSIHEVLFPIAEDNRFDSDIKIIHNQISSKEKDDFYQSLVLEEIKKDPTNSWIIWFSVQYYFKYGPKEDLIENLKLYINVSEKRTDIRWFCLKRIIKLLPYEESVFYAISLLFEFNSKETLEYLISWAVELDKPEFILFLSTLIRGEGSEMLRKASLERLKEC
jgi:hypothetical protein